MKRRRLLRVGVASALVGFAGCATTSNDTKSTPNDAGATSDDDDESKSTTATRTPTATLTATSEPTTDEPTTNEPTTNEPTTGGPPDGQREDAKLPASNGTESDYYGKAVAIEGDTVVVGAPGRDAEGVGGLAYVFGRTDGTWTQETTLPADDGARGDTFGAAVAVAEDTIAVGAPGDLEPGSEATGSAYVFERTDGTWTQNSKLQDETRSDDDEFGWGIETNGERVLVSAHRDWGPNDDAHTVGSISVFERSGDEWTQETVLRASDGSKSDQFGIGFSLSGDTVVVGASTKETAEGHHSGGAYVFAHDDDGWRERTQFAPDTLDAFDRLGRSVAQHGDLAFVTAQDGETDEGKDTGVVYVLERSNGSWAYTSKLGPAHTNDRRESGDSVGVGERYALFRTKARTQGGDLRNAVTVYDHDDALDEFTRLVASDGDDDDRFGNAVAVSDGTAIVGAKHDEDPNGEFAGSAYVYDL